MRMKMMIVRSLTAAVLFLVLAKLNVWSNKDTHLVLAVGYRAFLLCAPVFLIFGLSRGMRGALVLCAVAAGLATIRVDILSMGLLAVGMAVSGYFAKYVAAHTNQGAADNKVSLNVGSLFSGLLLMLPLGKPFLLGTGAALLVIAAAIGWFVDWESVEPPKIENPTSRKASLDPIPLVGWALVGVATGIKLTGIFTILPQYLLARTGALPGWFGGLIILNSVLVILVQHRVLDVLERFPQYLFPGAISAMLFLAMPAVLHVEHFSLAMVWVVLLTIGECALSRYDRTAKEAGYLFPKELMVGVGSFATVWLARTFPEAIHWSGLLGVGCLALGIVLTNLGGAYSIRSAVRS